MVSDDTDDAKAWQLSLRGSWRAVAVVTDPEGESSGIVDASKWFGGGTWLLDVQGHGTNVEEEQIGDVVCKMESGQLLLLTFPASYAASTRAAGALHQRPDCGRRRDQHPGRRLIEGPSFRRGCACGGASFGGERTHLGQRL